MTNSLQARTGAAGGVMQHPVQQLSAGSWRLAIGGWRLAAELCGGYGQIDLCASEWADVNWGVVMLLLLLLLFYYVFCFGCLLWFASFAPRARSLPLLPRTCCVRHMFLHNAGHIRLRSRVCRHVSAYECVWACVYRQHSMEGKRQIDELIVGSSWWRRRCAVIFSLWQQHTQGDLPNAAKWMQFD